jgi:hypothetical protein
MHRFQLNYGVRVPGEHMALSRLLLGELREHCRACHGRGALQLASGSTRDCPHCESTGGVWACSEETLAAAYMILETLYPGCTTTGIKTPALRFLDRPYRHREGAS